VNLGLRNWLAGICLEEISAGGSGGAVAALAGFAERADRAGVAAGLGEEAARILGRSTKIFERAGDEVQLAPSLLADLPELRWRAARFVDAIAGCRECCGVPPLAAVRDRDRRSAGMPPSNAEIGWTICAAATLFNAGLFFETHELLEPCWLRAEGSLRMFLQGLIQIAAGLHHEQNGNRRGAISLLGEGSGKLRSFGSVAHGIDLATFLTEIAELTRALAAPAPVTELRVPRLTVVA